MERRLRRFRDFHLKKPWRKKKGFPGGIVVDTTRTALEVLKESADACPPLKSAVGGVIAIWDTHIRAKTCKRDVEDLVRRVCEVLYSLQEVIGDPRDIHPQMLQSIEKFQRLLGEILEVMEKLAKTKYLARLTSLNRNEERLLSLKQKLDEVLELFKVCSAARTELGVSEVRSGMVEIHKETLEIRGGVGDMRLMLQDVQSKHKSQGEILLRGVSEAQRIVTLQLASTILF